MPAREKTVYLVDGSSYIHRAYHAIKTLSTSKGFPTNAIFGFTKMLLKLMAAKEPRYLAVVFDAKGPTFRHEIYEAYKANRPSLPEDLAVQIPMIKSVVKNLNIPMVEVEGYEADDVIGTLARIFEEKGFEVVMVSGDKDLRQLVTPRTSMWDSMRDRIIDYASLKEIHGFEPKRLIDVMALSGDSIDNIPGVPGVGEKTAVDLMRQFGSVENLLEHLEEVKGRKIKENLQRFKENALLSKKLVTIDRYAPVEEENVQMSVGEPDRDELAKIFREMEFRGLWDQYTVRKETSGDYSYGLCLTREALLALVKEIEETGMVSVQTVSSGESPFEAKLVGISFCCEEGRAFYLPLAHRYLGAPSQLDWKEAKEIIGPVMANEGIGKVGQNIKHDAEVLKRYGLDLKGIRFDTMIASYVINPGLKQHDLKYLAQYHLNYRMLGYEEMVGKGKNASDFSGMNVEDAKNYSCEDAHIVLRLKRILEQKLRSEKNEELFYELEMKLLPVLMDMEMTGVKIDIGLFERMSLGFAQQMEEIEKEIFREAGMRFNINSPQQLGFVLFEKLKLPGQKKTAKTRNYSTQGKVLETLSAFSYRIPQLVLRYRTLSKLKSTYLDALVRMVESSTGRIHTSFNQTVAATGRLSSSNPNLQNIPIRGEGKEIRKGFVAEEGHFLVSADYSQVELRVFAHYSGDEAFMEAFRQGEDIHTRTASEILAVDPQGVTPQMRRIAKAINFGIIYGMGPQRLSEELGIDRKTAQNYIETYYDRYRGVARYREQVLEMARENGYVSTLFNRRRYLPDIHHSKRVVRAEAERMAINTPIQGTAADLIKRAMIQIHQRLEALGSRSKLLLQVHDELVFEVPEEEVQSLISLIKEEMEGVYPLKVPLKVDIHKGKNWDEAH